MTGAEQGSAWSASLEVFDHGLQVDILLHLVVLYSREGLVLDRMSRIKTYL